MFIFLEKLLKNPVFVASTNTKKSVKCCGDCVIACRRETSHCSRIDCRWSDCAAGTYGGLSSTANVQSFGPSGEPMKMILITEPHSKAFRPSRSDRCRITYSCYTCLLSACCKYKWIMGNIHLNWVCLFYLFNNNNNKNNDNNPYTGSGVCFPLFRLYLGILLWFSAVNLLWKNNKTYLTFKLLISDFLPKLTLHL